MVIENTAGCLQTSFIYKFWNEMDAKAYLITC